jgi:hypothetical protein
MHEAALSAWESFYVIVGSSGGALIGLQFVVITLIADRKELTSPGALSAFGTPTVVHFAAALTISAIMSAPWPSLRGPALLMTACGIAGLIYVAVVMRRALRQTEYKPVFEDWIFYLILPATSYGVLSIAGVMMARGNERMLYPVAAVALALLLIGIHNAWDTVTHIAFTGVGKSAPEKPQS